MRASGGSGADGSGDGGDDDGSGGGSGEGSNGIPTAETVVMAVSVAFTLALFGFALWHALVGPGAVAPTVSVVDSQPAPGGVQYTVVLSNRGDLGLVTATVEADCTDPPVEVVFENVPADGRRTGTVVCPPGTVDPAVSVTSWIQE